MSTVNALKVALSELAALRSVQEKLGADLKARQTAFNAENAPLLNARDEVSAAIVVHEQQVRALALTCFDLTGEKKPVEGASVVIRTTYSYDADEALRWAETALPTAITRKLDTKAIDKIASTGTLPFATKIETPSVNISSDLSEWLAIPEPSVTNE